MAGLTSSRIDARRGVIGSASTNVRLTDEVLAYMDQAGDHEIHLAAPVIKLSVPTYRYGSPKLGSCWATSGGKARSCGVFSCSLLARDGESVFAVATKSVYLFPSERITLDDIVEMVAHVHCDAAFPTLEIRVGNADGTSDVRHVAFANEYLLRQATAVMVSACHSARLTFHSLSWVSTRKGGLGVDDDIAGLYGDDGDGVLPPSERMLRLKQLASNTAITKLQAYHKKKQGDGRGVSSVVEFGPGHYSEAADSLHTDLTRMMREVDKMLHIEVADTAPSLRAMEGGAVPPIPASPLETAATTGDAVAAPATAAPTAGLKPLAAPPAAQRRSRSKTIRGGDLPAEVVKLAQSMRNR